MTTTNIYDVEEIKRSITNWTSIFTWAGIPEESLTGNHGPCPKCGGTDRFRLLDRDDGSLHCNQCFREKNGDGIAALAWWWGTSFPETLDRLAEYLGVEPEKKTSKKKRSDPAAKLEFIDWVETFANLYCQHNPGVTVEALKLAGARMAYYYNQHTVIALPIYGPKLLDAKPVGWIVQDFMGGTLPRFDKSGNVVEWVKRKITYGSQPGVVGDAAARGLADPNIDTAYKMEGPSDMLAMMVCLLAEPRPGTIAITTANGAGEDWRKHPWLIDRLKGRELRVIHDCDQPGQKGAESILAAVSKACTAKNYVLPYPVQESKGADFRDWINSGVQQPVATLDAAFAKIEASQAEPEIYFGADNSPHVLASKFLAEQRRDGKNVWRYWREEWYQWIGDRYRAVSLSDFKLELTSTLNRYAMESFAVAQQQGKEQEHPFKVTIPLVNNVANALAGECRIPGEVAMGSMYEDGRWVKRDYLAMKNGILDVQGYAAEKIDILLPHTPNWFSVVNLGYDYDEDVECPKWTSFLSKNLEGDQERISLLQEWAGYLLTPDTSQQRFMILEGEGANGKSVFIAGITAMLNPDNVSNLSLELFGQPFSLAGTIGKLANIAPDCGEIDRMAEGILKSFTSGDIIRFDRKYKSDVSDRPTARLMAATNNKPRFSDRSDGIWRRMILVPWRVQIPPKERIYGMDTVEFWQNTGELPAILRWALRGLRDLRRNRQFTVSRVCEEAKNFYRIESNPAREFLTEKYKEDSQGFVPTAEMYKKYSEWCQENGYKPLGNRMFGKEVSRVFKNSERARRKISLTGTVYGYLGVSEIQEKEFSEENF